MTDEIWQRAEADSPCQKICVIHPASGYCIGCLRTIGEISDWSKLSQTDREQIKAALPARASAIRGSRKGRRNRRRAQG